jgi:hypothetical protein
VPGADWRHYRDFKPSFNGGNLENPGMFSVSHKLNRESVNPTRQYGGADCRDIAGMDWHNREMFKAFLF